MHLKLEFILDNNNEIDKLLCSKNKNKSKCGKKSSKMLLVYNNEIEKMNLKRFFFFDYFILILLNVTNQYFTEYRITMQLHVKSNVQPVLQCSSTEMLR